MLAWRRAVEPGAWMEAAAAETVGTAGAGRRLRLSPDWEVRVTWMASKCRCPAPPLRVTVGGEAFPEGSPASPAALPAPAGPRRRPRVGRSSPPGERQLRSQRCKRVFPRVTGYPALFQKLAKRPAPLVPPPKSS